MGSEERYIKLFHELLIALMKYKLTDNQGSFIFCLWRYTYGLRNSKYKKESGKYMDWNPTLFIEETGMRANKVSESKRDLIDRRVLIHKEGETQIGMNKHWEQWKLPCRLSREKMEERMKDANGLHPVFMEQFRGLPENGKSQAEKPNDVETLDTPKDKERKRKKRESVKYSPEFSELWTLWSKYKKNEKKKAYAKYLSYTGKGIEHKTIMRLAKEYIADMEAQRRRGRRRQEECQPGKWAYFKHLQFWLTSEPWEDEAPGAPPEKTMDEEEKRLRKKYGPHRNLAEMRFLERIEETERRVKEERAQPGYEEKMKKREEEWEIRKQAAMKRREERLRKEREERKQ